MPLFKLQIILGLALIIAGFIFDFGFITTTKNFTEVLSNTSASSAWTKHVYELIRFYLFMLGFLNIALALLIPPSTPYKKIERIIIGLVAGGSIFVILGGLLEAQHTGPAYTWGLACYVLSSGLFAILLGLVLEIYTLLFGKDF